MSTVTDGSTPRTCGRSGSRPTSSPCRSTSTQHLRPEPVSLVPASDFLSGAGTGLRRRVNRIGHFGVHEHMRLRGVARRAAPAGSVDEQALTSLYAAYAPNVRAFVRTYT